MINKVYKDYPEMPYINEARDIEDWIENPHKYPYSKVEKKQMVRLDEGLLPGDVVLLWRIGFNNFTNETHIPDYFEYRYGVNAYNSLQLLMDKGYVVEWGVIESMDLIGAAQLKSVLKKYNLKLSGKKDDLIQRIIHEISETELEKEIKTRKYLITEDGQKVLDKYTDEIIKKHGIKQM